MRMLLRTGPALALLTAFWSISLSAPPTRARTFHDGTLESAIEKAVAKDRPLLVYWRAQWSAPCIDLEAGALDDGGVRRRLSKDFVAVRLDADGDGTQAWAERLDVHTYPTLQVLRPDRTEIVRLVPDLPADLLKRLLADAAAEERPLDELLADAKEGPGGKVDARVWRLLAFHDWNHDRLLRLDASALEKLFRELEARVPHKRKVARTRLFTRWLGFASLAATAAGPAGKPPAIGAEKRARAGERLRDLLEDTHRLRENLDLLLYGAGAVIPWLEPRPGPGRTQLIAAWAMAAARLGDSKKLADSDRLATMLPRIEIDMLERGEQTTSQALQTEVQRRVEWAEERAEDRRQRQTMTNIAGLVLARAKMLEAARSLYARHLEGTGAPYYFMSQLSSLWRLGGDPARAVEWRRRAYDSAAGSSTRIDLGAAYLDELVERRPDDGRAIQAESLRILPELVTRADAFAGNNRARLEQLAGRYAAWSVTEAGGPVVAELRTRLSGACGDLPETAGGLAVRSRCQEFIAGLAARR